MEILEEVRRHPDLNSCQNVVGLDEEGAEEAGDEDDKDCPPNEEDADADADADAEPAEDEAQQGEEDQDLDGEGCFEPTIIQIYRKTENGQVRIGSVSVPRTPTRL